MVLNPGFKVHSRSLLAKHDLPALVQSVREHVKVAINSALGLSITLDAWNSDGHKFLAITGHYITEEHQLKTNTLGFISLPESHTADKLHEQVNDTVSQYLPEGWNTAGLLYCATTDGAANMVSFGRSTKHGYTWTRCFAHLLNLIVGNSLEQFEVGKLLDKLRKLRTKFKYDQRFKTAFEEAQKHIGKAVDGPTSIPLCLLMDCPTRWNSTFLMLERAFSCRPSIRVALTQLEEADEDLVLTQEEWGVVEYLSQLLKPFAQATEAVSSQTEVTISKPLPFLSKRQSMLEQQLKSGSGTNTESKQKFLKILLTNLSKRKKEYEKESKVPLLGSLLDPRFKNDFLTETGNVKLLEDLITATTSDNSHPTAPSNEVCQKRQDQEIRDSELFEADAPCRQIPAKQEVCHYQQEPKSEIGKDPLIWWNANQGKYPRLYKLAMKTLSAQATEVPSERAFSAAGLMHTKLRRSMLPNTLCQRLFVYANHPSLLESRQYQENESDTSDDEQ